jgi:hypothetical protein
MRGGRKEDPRGGFALALVVLMLFAIAVAGITGYQVVSTELVMSRQNRDAAKALSVARAGLQRFLGEQVGDVGDSVSYAIGDGIATVTTRRVVAKDSLNHLYYIRSSGTVADPRRPSNPARREVGTYAWQRLAPIPLKGALWVSGGALQISYSSYFSTVAHADGYDHATAFDCAGGGTAGAAGVVRGGTVTANGGGSYVGNPPSVGYAGFDAVYDTVGVRWDVLTSPSFPVDFEDVMPDFTTLPADSFPIVRFNGSLTEDYTHGRGVLLVNGTFVPGYDFQWDGIILAGTLGDVGSSYGSPPHIRGMLIGGLNGANPDVTLQSGVYDYHSCNAYKADRALSYLEVVDKTVFEING